MPAQGINPELLFSGAEDKVEKKYEDSEAGK